MASSHHAYTERAHQEARRRRHDQRRDPDCGEPIPTERKAAADDSEAGNGKDTAIPDPEPQHAGPDRV
jgi:hypothetical protein